MERGGKRGRWWWGVEEVVLLDRSGAGREISRFVVRRNKNIARLASDLMMNVLDRGLTGLVV